MSGAGPPTPPPRPRGGTDSVSGRVAAVCPYIQVPAGGRAEADLSPKHTPFGQVRSHSGWYKPTISISISGGSMSGVVKMAEGSVI